MSLILVFRPHQSPAWAAAFPNKQAVVDAFTNDEFAVPLIGAPCNGSDWEQLRAMPTVDEKFSLATEIIGHDLNSLAVLESADEVFRYINEREYYGQHNKGIGSVWRQACELGWVPEYRIAEVEADGSLADVDNFFAQNDAAAVAKFRESYDSPDFCLLDPKGGLIPVDA
jgi:hypothetical protein